MFQIGLRELAIALEINQLHDSQQDFILDGNNDHGFYIPAFSFTETLIELQARMDVYQLITA
jgi:hypothetical protein